MVTISSKSYYRKKCIIIVFKCNTSTNSILDKWCISKISAIQFLRIILCNINVYFNVFPFFSVLTVNQHQRGGLYQYYYSYVTFVLLSWYYVMIKLSISPFLFPTDSSTNLVVLGLCSGVRLHSPVSRNMFRFPIIHHVSLPALVFHLFPFVKGYLQTCWENSLTHLSVVVVYRKIGL